MHRLLKIYIFFIGIVANFPTSSSQVRGMESFQSDYIKTGQLIRNTTDSLEKLVEVMRQSDSLTEIQKAKLDLLRSKMTLLDEMWTLTQIYEEVIPDTSGNENHHLRAARIFIIQSRPDYGIPIILKYLESADNESDSAIYAKIYLAEAYRQKQEYNKGIGIISAILGNYQISPVNRAFALNRMAALMSEKRMFAGNKADSVTKYSRLCMDIAKKYNFMEYYASSLNELGNNYLRLNMPDSALMLISEAARNFESIHLTPQTINTYLNLSRIYTSLGQLDKSKEILIKALELGNIEENRNLLKYVYYHLAVDCFKMGDVTSAYEYLNISYSLMSHFFDDRIQMQINEMSAKFDLKEKEAKLKEQEQKNRTYQLRVKYIFIISFISISLLVVLVLLFRFKNQAYKKLVEQTLKSLKLEKQVELWLRNLSENDIRQKIYSDDRNSELALRLEKYLAEEKPYLWCDVTLEEFCKKLNTNRTYLSKLINDEYNMSFYDLLFEYRVRAALEYLNNLQYDHLSVEGIGEMAGFKSNSNFYKRFKNMVGMTPYQFRENARKIKTHRRIQDK